MCCFYYWNKLVLVIHCVLHQRDALLLCCGVTARVTNSFFRFHIVTHTHHAEFLSYTNTFSFLHQQYSIRIYICSVYLSLHVAWRRMTAPPWCYANGRVLKNSTRRKYVLQLRYPYRWFHFLQEKNYLDVDVESPVDVVMDVLVLVFIMHDAYNHEYLYCFLKCVFTVKTREWCSSFLTTSDSSRRPHRMLHRPCSSTWCGLAGRF